MSTILQAYVVPIERLQAVIGSKKKKYITELARATFDGRSVRDYWSMIDEVRDDAPITARQALEELVMGRPQRRNCNDLYTYTLELLCVAYGRRAGAHLQHPRHLEHVNADWMWDVNEALSKAGVESVLFKMYGPLKRTRALPMSLRNDGWPFGTLIPYEKCARAREQIVEHIGKIKRPYRDAALELRHWLDEVGAADVLAIFEY